MVLYVLIIYNRKMATYSKRKELSRDKFLTPDECARLCSQPAKNSLLGLRDYAILKIFLNCGLRKNELISLRVGDFCRQGENYWLVVHSKGGTIDEQDIMNDRTITAIQKYLNTVPHGDQPDQPLFQPVGKRAKTESKKLSRRSIDFMIKKYTRRAGITKKVTAHVLRHTFGTEFQALTGDIKSTQAAMRHRSLNSTMIYLHTDRDRVKQGLSRMNL
jgi:site-specific recombinase XerD